MLRLNIIAKEDIAKSVQNRTVCDVTQTIITDSIFGKLISWRGSVIDEYFSIVFSKGLLAISIAEREMLLGRNPISYAMSESFSDALKNVSKQTDIEGKTEAASDYNLIIAPKEQNEITILDVMLCLNWKFCENPKIYENDYELT